MIISGAIKATTKMRTRRIILCLLVELYPTTSGCAETHVHREVVTRHIQMISWYWHFVDAVWVVVFTVVYVIGR